MKKILEELNNIYSVSSVEKELNIYLKNYYKKYCDELIEDRLYSAFGIKKGQGKLKVMVACAMDEIGLMVNEVKNDGKISFLALEGLAPVSLCNQAVTIINRNNELIKGYICVNQKLMENSLDKVSMKDLYIVTTLMSDEVVNKVKPGDLVAIDGNFIFSNDKVVGRSLNQKVMQAIQIKLLEKLRDVKLPYDLYVGSIAQSTIGFRGSKTSTHVIEPDLAISLTGFEINNSNINFNDGVILGHYDKQMLPDKELLYDFDSKIKCKPYIGMLGNDGSFIHKTLKGTPTISIGIPMMNMGTPNVIVDTKDIDALIDSLSAYLQSINYKIGERDYE